MVSGECEFIYLQSPHAADDSTLYTVLQVTENPYMYDLHTQLITELRQAGELEQLRKAREKMSEIFPLSEGRNVAVRVGICIILTVMMGICVACFLTDPKLNWSSSAYACLK